MASLTRNVAGLIARQGGAGGIFNTADYTQSGLAMTLGSSSNALLSLATGASATGYGFLRFTPAGTRGKALVFTRGKVQSAGGNFVQFGPLAANDATTGVAEVTLVNITTPASSLVGLRNMVSGSPSSSNTTTGLTRAVNTAYDQTVFHDGDAFVGYDHLAAATNVLTGSRSSGAVGFLVHDNSNSVSYVFEINLIIVLADRYVYITGLTPESDQVVRVRNSGGTVLASATEDGSGNAVLDMLTFNWAGGGAHDVAIFEADGTTLIHAHAQSGGVWAGDVYEASGLPGGNEPPPAPVYVSPAADATVGGSSLVIWTQGADPDDDTITHRGETRPSGGSASAWFDGQAAGVLERALPGLDEGTYEFRIGADDGVNDTAWAAWRAVTILNNAPPVASFSHVVDGLSIAFTDTSTDPDGTIVAWKWERDDVEFSTEQHPFFIAEEVGTATYRLTVTDDGGKTHSTALVIAVGATDDPADITKWIKNWNHNYTTWARASSNLLLQTWGRSAFGAIRRPSALGRVPLGTSLGWRITGRVLLGVDGYRWTWHRYLGAELMLGGLSVSLDPAPFGKGVFFGIGDGTFVNGHVFPSRGSGRGSLKIGTLNGTSATESSLALPKIYVHDLATRYWNVWYTLEMDVQQIGGSVRVLGRINTPLPSADIPAPLINVGGELWHMQRTIGGTLDCAYAGFAYRAEWNNIFNDGWVRFAGLEATPYDAETCAFVPPEPEEFEPTQPVDDPEPSTAAPLEKAWAFTHDGHVFYVLHLLNGTTIICDLTTGQWHSWLTGENTFWNMFRGFVWKGRVLAADVSEPRIWALNPTSTLDEGGTPIQRVVTGFQPIRGTGAVRQGSLRLTARRDDLGEEGATVVMQFSDDGGNTWSAEHTVTLLPGDVSRRIEYRSLGRMRAPGRLWQFSDVGGLVRIDGVDSDVEGQ